MAVVSLAGILTRHDYGILCSKISRGSGNVKLDVWSESYDIAFHLCVNIHSRLLAERIWFIRRVFVAVFHFNA